MFLNNFPLEIICFIMRFSNSVAVEITKASIIIFVVVVIFRGFTLFLLLILHGLFSCTYNTLTIFLFKLKYLSLLLGMQVSSGLLLF